MAKIHVLLISPALARANNGNWQTAFRWLRFLRDRYQVTLASEWAGQPGDLMIALHARRSAASIAAFAQAYPTRPLIVVLTGTDLYRDIDTDASAQHSLQVATRLVVLQEAGVSRLPHELQHKAIVIYQSAPALKPMARSVAARFARITMVGHLRDEKDPLTFMRAAALIGSPRIRMIHIGGALDPELARRAEATQAVCPHYRWLGSLPHAATRQFLKRSHLMVIASKMEGGANVIIEAVTSGVPVLASDIEGNRGMLGDDYDGYFPVGDSTALAQLIERAVNDELFYAQLLRKCMMRAPMFAPEQEEFSLLHLMDNVLHKERH